MTHADKIDYVKRRVPDFKFVNGHSLGQRIRTGVGHIDGRLYEMSYALPDGVPVITYDDLIADGWLRVLG